MKIRPRRETISGFELHWNGIPLIYSGQEIPNMERLKFFDKDTIEWPQENDLHEFYKALLDLKKEILRFRQET
jgi:hypothetical protein